MRMLLMKMALWLDGSVRLMASDVFAEKVICWMVRWFLGVELVRVHGWQDILDEAYHEENVYQARNLTSLKHYQASFVGHES